MGSRDGWLLWLFEVRRGMQDFVPMLLRLFWQLFQLLLGTEVIDLVYVLEVFSSSFMFERVESSILEFILRDKISSRKLVSLLELYFFLCKRSENWPVVTWPSFDGNFPFWMIWIFCACFRWLPEIILALIVNVDEDKVTLDLHLRERWKSGRGVI